MSWIVGWATYLSGVLSILRVFVGWCVQDFNFARRLYGVETLLRVCETIVWGSGGVDMGKVISTLVSMYCDLLCFISLL